MHFLPPPPPIVMGIGFKVYGLYKLRVLAQCRLRVHCANLVQGPKPVDVLLRTLEHSPDC